MQVKTVQTLYMHIAFIKRSAAVTKHPKAVATKLGGVVTMPAGDELLKNSQHAPAPAHLDPEG